MFIRMLIIGNRVEKVELFMWKTKAQLYDVFF